MNYPSDVKYMKEMWRCDSCQSAIDTQSHVMWCSAYTELRKNKDLSNDRDIAKYIQQVLNIRSKVDIVK